MLSFFKKKAAKSEEAANGKTMKAYLTGKVIPIEEVNDGVFSAKIMGDGIAIIPENEVLTAPADGEITVVMDGSFHAVGMRLDNGVEVLLHIGVDTVKLAGKGFKLLTQNGAKVKAGTPLIQFDRKVIAEAGYQDTVIMAVTNSNEYAHMKKAPDQAVKAGETPVIEF